jgi:hypothetical protein
MDVHASRGTIPEPLEWIQAHARTVAWCLEAAYALRQSGRVRRRLCQSAADNLPRPFGSRASIQAAPLIREQTRTDVSDCDFVGGMLEDYLWINLRGVRRRVQYRNGKLHSMWGGNSLIESVYTQITDSITNGRLAQCAAPDCGAIFIQTDQRQEYCPKREGQAKSACMNRIRVRRYRDK